VNIRTQLIDISVSSDFYIMSGFDNAGSSSVIGTPTDRSNALTALLPIVQFCGAIGAWDADALLVP
jgi:hypothetical protein